jgi:glycine/D-amino acid oxidase-like deaminating enzyme
MRAVVVGGGLIGCAIAWRLAQRDVHVTVVEKHEPASKASWAAAGMLLPMMEPNSPLQPLTDASFALFPSFVHELQSITNIDAELQLEHVGGSVDSRKLARAAYEAGVVAGVHFVAGVAARRVASHGGRVRQVVLGDDTTVDCDVVIVAAGAWSSEVRGLPFRLPVVPVRGQMLAVSHESTLVPHIVHSDECYLVPRGETRTLIGATVEKVGFDETVTDEGIAQLLRSATELVPEIAMLPIVEKWAGLRPGTPDDLPILGADRSIAGLYYATGHYRNGILLAPVTAQVLTEMVVEGESSADLSAFAAERFVVDVSSPRCDLCGAAMKEWHCRIICMGCGYQRDCSDP